MTKKINRAFTLVEILAILSIMGILLIFSFLAIPKQIIKARDAVRKNHIRRVASALEEYQEDNNCYPISLPLCTNSLKSGDLILINELPCDPSTDFSYVYVAESGECPSWFQLYGILENKNDPIIEKVDCQNGCGPDCQFNFGIASTNQVLDPFCGELGEDDDPEPPETVDQYVCAPSGECEVFADPEISGCPDIYPNDPTCQDKCEDRIYRCHDSRGKSIP